MHPQDYIFIDFPVKDYLKGNNMTEVNVREPLSIPMRFLRKLPGFSRCISNTKELDGWTDACRNAKRIILFDTFAHYSQYCSRIEKTAPRDARLILYMLNPAFFSDNYKNISSRWEIWTFTKEDAMQHGFKYGATFFNPLLLDYTAVPPDSKQANAVTDLLFVGTNKGRKPLLSRLQNKLQHEDIACDFRIVDNFKSLYNREYSREVSYLRLCKLICNSNAILDVVQNGQTGMTLRIMEGILFGKKIVTTNQSLRHYSDFDQCGNIYELTADNINGLAAFLKSPATPYPQWMKEKYSFCNWLQRLENNIEA